jgi:GST-like protein
MGQTNHFFSFAPEQIPYAQKRYLNESKRLCEVIDKQLGVTNAYIAGPNYSIADMAMLTWLDYFLNKHGHRLDGATYPNIERWRKELLARPAVQSGYARSPFPK